MLEIAKCPVQQYIKEFDWTCFPKITIIVQQKVLGSLSHLSRIKKKLHSMKKAYIFIRLLTFTESSMKRCYLDKK
jgi:hypothetical protein